MNGAFGVGLGPLSEQPPGAIASRVEASVMLDPPVAPESAAPPVPLPPVAPPAVPLPVPPPAPASPVLDPPAPLPVAPPPVPLPLAPVEGLPVVLDPDWVPELVLPGPPGVGGEVSLAHGTTTSQPQVPASRVRFISPSPSGRCRRKLADAAR